MLSPTQFQPLDHEYICSKKWDWKDKWISAKVHPRTSGSQLKFIMSSLIFIFISKTYALKGTIQKGWDLGQKLIVSTQTSVKLLVGEQELFEIERTNGSQLKFIICYGVLFHMH